MVESFAIVDDPLFDCHHAPGPHPERPERLEAARAALLQARLAPQPRLLEPRDASDQELGRVHSRRHLEFLASSSGKSGRFDADTYFAPDSIRAARRAAGGAIQLVESVLNAQSRFGVGLLRPPGHHARPDQPMGFCLLNNVAVAAAHARALRASRVMIVDFDVHHGNGTQEIFYEDASVLFASVHQFPFYPGTGSSSELGNNGGLGFSANIPLSAFAGDAAYVAAFDRIISPIAAEFAPDLVLVSAGFDAHERDPLASMRLTSTGYRAMMESLLSALPLQSRRVVVLLEGGYDLQGITDSLAATLEGIDHILGGAPRTALPDLPLASQHERDLTRARNALASYWKL